MTAIHVLSVVSRGLFLCTDCGDQCGRGIDMNNKMDRFIIGNSFKKFVAGQLEVVGCKYGIKRTELNIFMYLCQAPEANTARDIQDYLCINKGYLSHVLDKLCTKGYLEAVPDKLDRRYIHYIPTGTAEPMMKELCQTKSMIDEELFSGVTEEEFAVLERVFARVEQNMCKILEKGI